MSHANRGYYTSMNTASNIEWYTPSHIIEKARHVMNGIDLDPYTSESAQITVQASHYFTKESDGLISDWPRVNSVWVNPPYAKGLIEPCINRLITEYKIGTYKTAIVLVNNSTETEWFHRLLGICAGGCMIHKRISFINGSGMKVHDQNTRGQIALYIGDDFATFVDTFNSNGMCFKCV